MNVFDVLREKLKQKKKILIDLSNEHRNNDKRLSTGYANKALAMGDAIEIVNQVEQEYNNGWIPCSERLPENNKVVLCWVRSTTIASGETFIIGSCDHGFWFLQTYEIGHHHFPVKDYEVIAWQPLPEPYEPKGE